MQQNTDDVNIGVSEKFFSSFLSNLLSFGANLWFESRLLLSSLVGVALDSFLLLESVVSERLEMSLDRSMLSFSDVEESGFFIIDSCRAPFFVSSVVLNLSRLITFS